MENSIQDILEYKKRYANRSVRNLGNSRLTNDDCIVVLTHIAWAAIITSVCKAILGPLIEDVNEVVHAF